MNDMAKLTKINSDEVLNFYNEIYGSQVEIVPKCKDKKEKIEKNSLNTDALVEEDETSIYEYDYDCIKKSGFLDRIIKATVK